MEKKISREDKGFIFLMYKYVDVSSSTSTKAGQKLCLCNKKNLGLFTTCIYEEVIGVSKVPVTE